MKDNKFKCTMEIKRHFLNLYASSIKMCVDSNIPEISEKSSIEYQIQHKKTWELVYNIYPELINHEVSYDADSNCLVVTKYC